MGGAPHINQVNPNQVVNAILGGARREFPQFENFQNRFFPGVADFGQSMLSGVTGLTDPLMRSFGQASDVAASGGAMTATEAAGLNAPLAAEAGQAGMGYTAPSVFEKGMNTYQEMQRRFNTAVSQQGTIGSVIQALQGGALAGAESSVLGPLAGYTSMLGSLSGPIASQMLANQQAQAANATAGANKTAGIGSALLNVTASAAAAY